ncbi:anti-phage dCTP deaminase [Acetobacter syzygii]|uniref:anti-phage dCTP deaminase n=1 Tax=Acetobacter syzygii TaxID=146476 RepID=UPI001C2CEEA2|nr:anti-phage dCTP deaminase [Acetobacter syzygii]
MSDALTPEEYPELVIGLAGPIGIDTETLTTVVKETLAEVEYQTEIIRLTNIMVTFNVAEKIPRDTDEEGFASEVKYKINYANKLREEKKDNAFLAKIAIAKIITERGSIQRKSNGIAYIIRQLKRPEEVNFLRKIYGNKFILISAYAHKEGRINEITKKLKQSVPVSFQDPRIAFLVSSLIEKDENEGKNKYGQRLGDTFHLGDVFVDGIRRDKMYHTLRRFMQALFGRTDISPTKSEFGMFTAKSASLRSTDLSRQVGAAIFSPSGEIISQGCNEVPKANGGTYWDSEEPDFRDIKKGIDPNDRIKKEIIRDLFERLENEGWLSEKALQSGKSINDISLNSIKKGSGPLSGALITDLTEYGRVVHAEMCSICDAARSGRSVKGSTLFCTTFPCHNCTKHIIASGIKNVYYIEPYPKSRAKELHEDEISFEEIDEKKVSFVPFMGISPHFYKEIFEKNRRKNSDGTAKYWYSDTPKPQIESFSTITESLEKLVTLSLFSENEEQNSSTSDCYDKLLKLYHLITKKK